MNKELSIRNKIIKTCLILEQKKLNQCKSGNVSCRWNNGFLITPSGMSYNKINSDDIVYINDNKIFKGKRKPSIEWQFHYDIFKNKKNVNVIIHNHPPYATGLSILQKNIKPYHYMIAFFGGNDVKCAKFALPGSKKLSQHVIKSLNNRNACLLSNHGSIIVGSDFDETLILTEELETLCKQITIAKINGVPKLVSQKNMKDVLKAIKNYGKQ